MTFIEFIEATLLGMAGWAVFSVAISMIASTAKQHKLAKLKEAAADLKRLNDFLLKKVEELEKKKDNELESVEKRDIIKE